MEEEDLPLKWEAGGKKKTLLVSSIPKMEEICFFLFLLSLKKTRYKKIQFFWLGDIVPTQ